MSDYLAVGAVTAVLKSLLNAGLTDGGPSTVLASPPGVTNVPPDFIATGNSELPQLNLFMYYASINPALRNMNLPAFDANGAALASPPLAINLHYLVSAYGAQPYDAEILLAFAMQVFHNTPVVPRASIQAALTALGTSAGPSNEQRLVAASNLASQIEHIRITPEALTTEEIYRLWTAFQVHYRPTTSYQVSVVVIQNAQSYQSNRPAQRRAFLALPLAGPTIAAVTPTQVAPGQTLKIAGANFLSGPPSATQVAFDQGAPVPCGTIQGDLIRVTPPGALPAGQRSLRVLSNVVFPPNATRPGFSSNAFPFQLVPAIAEPTPSPYSVKQGAALAITVAPAVGSRQSVVVYIGDTAIPLPQGPLATPSSSTVVTVTVPGTIAAGIYPLRVEVDGAQSLLTQDQTAGSPTQGQWLPQVQVTS
jgi:hypothetical protein